MPTSENPLSAKFGEFTFHDVGSIGVGCWRDAPPSSLCRRARLRAPSQLLRPGDAGQARHRPEDEATSARASCGERRVFGVQGIPPGWREAALEDEPKRSPGVRAEGATLTGTGGDDLTSRMGAPRRCGASAAGTRCRAVGGGIVSTGAPGTTW
jgi:hypothetical protein